MPSFQLPLRGSRGSEMYKRDLFLHWSSNVQCDGIVLKICRCNLSYFDVPRLKKSGTLIFYDEGDAAFSLCLFLVTFGECGSVVGKERLISGEIVICFV